MISITLAEARRTIRAVETALRAGFPAPGPAAHGKVGAISAAAKNLGLSPATVRSRVIAGGACETQHGLAPDWTIKPAAPAKPEAPPPPPTDPVELRRLRDGLSRAQIATAAAERRAGAAENLRRAVFGLAAAPIVPPSFVLPKGTGDAQAEAIILPISDVHMGERISLDQMGGRNAYSEAIALKRIERLFGTAIKLSTKHWSGPPPVAIYVPLLGDLVSGEIHEELAKTNDLLSIPAVQAVSGALIAGLNLLLKAFPAVPVHVISVPGNHGRTTRKPEAKGFALNSYDTLVAWVLEAHFAAKAERRITFSAPRSGDALVEILGYNILFTHGDRIGSKGGAGFVGVAATATRGMKRLVEDYAAEGVILDTIVMGHFHTPLELEYGFVSGTLAGPSEYSRAGRLKSHPASQWMLTVHPRRGIARRWKILVGDPSEGSIYKGRSA